MMMNGEQDLNSDNGGSGTTTTTTTTVTTEALNHKNANDSNNIDDNDDDDDNMILLSSSNDNNDDDEHDGTNDEKKMTDSDKEDEDPTTMTMAMKRQQRQQTDQDQQQQQDHDDNDEEAVATTASSLMREDSGYSAGSGNENDSSNFEQGRDSTTAITSSAGAASKKPPMTTVTPWAESLCSPETSSIFSPSLPLQPTSTGGGGSTMTTNTTTNNDSTASGNRNNGTPSTTTTASLSLSNTVVGPGTAIGGGGIGCNSNQGRITTTTSQQRRPSPPPSNNCDAVGGTAVLVAVGHGHGIRKGMDRAKVHTRIGRRASTLFLDIANLEEQYIQSLSKWSLSSSSATSVAAVTGSGTSSGALSSSSALTSTATTSSTTFLRETLISWSMDVITKTSSTIKHDVGQPIRIWYTSTQNDTMNGIYERYMNCRARCYQARQRTILAHTKYVRAIRDAERMYNNSNAMQPVNKGSGRGDRKGSSPPQEGCEQADDTTTTPWNANIDNSGDNGGDDDDDGGSNTRNTEQPLPAAVSSMKLEELPKRVQSKIRYVHRRLLKYRQWIKVENECVKQCQRIELMVLESIQKIEHDRLILIMRSIIRILCARDQALQLLQRQQQKQQHQLASASEQVAEAEPEALLGTTAVLPTDTVSDGAAGNTTSGNNGGKNGTLETTPSFDSATTSTLPPSSSFSSPSTSLPSSPEKKIMIGQAARGKASALFKKIRSSSALGEQQQQQQQPSNAVASTTTSDGNNDNNVASTTTNSTNTPATSSATNVENTAASNPTTSGMATATMTTTTSSSAVSTSSTSGIMDAETLGLSENVGRLRDQVRDTLMARSKRLQTVKTLYNMLDAIAGASFKLGTGMKKRTSNNESSDLINLATASVAASASVGSGGSSNNAGTGTSGASSAGLSSSTTTSPTNTMAATGLTFASLHEEMKSVEGSRTLALWNVLRRMLDLDADENLDLSNHIRSIVVEKLERHVTVGDRKHRSMSDQDDRYWKQLCEASRAQMRAEERYRQATMQTAKVRERVRSVDGATAVAGTNDVATPTTSLQSSSSTGMPASNSTSSLLSSPLSNPTKQNKVGKHVTKGLANMFSILPDGGEQALKIFAPGARATIAQHNLDEADEKETKGRQMLDQAVEATAKATEKYRSQADALLSTFEQEERDGWDDIWIAVESVVRFAEGSRGRRLEASTRLRQEHRLETSDITGDVAELMNEWSECVRRDILQAAASSPSSSSVDSGFFLPLKPEESPVIGHFLAALQQSNSSSSSSSDNQGHEDEDDDDEEDDDDFETAPGGTLVSQPRDDEGVNNSNSTCDNNGAGNDAEPRDVSSTTSTAAALTKSQENQTPNWIQRSLNAANSTTGMIMMPDMSSMNLRGKLSLRNKKTTIPRSRIWIETGVDRETEIFATYFWPDTVDPSTIPAVVDSFACSFRDANQRLPSQYGRVFVSDARLIYVSWTGKKLTLRWSEIESIEIAKKSHDALLIVPRKDVRNVSLCLSGFYDLPKALDIMESIRNKAPGGPSEISISSSPGSVTTAKADVLPDDTMKKMKVILTRKIQNISVQRYYEIIWSEGCDTDAQPFYGPWLKKACFDVEVGDWEFDKEKSMGPWCREQYDQCRKITFKVKRKTHLYIGPPVANVVQTHFCRVEGNDKCVAALSVEFVGLPYADCFVVEQRWVARRVGDNDLLIESGVVVDFKKHTFLKKQISSGTIEETVPIAVNWFEAARDACISAGGASAAGPTDDGSGSDNEAVGDADGESRELATAKTDQGDVGKRFLADLDQGTMLMIGSCCAVILTFIVAYYLFFAGSTASYPIDNDMDKRMARIEDDLKLLHEKLDILISRLDKGEGILQQDDE